MLKSRKRASATGANKSVEVKKRTLPCVSNSNHKSRKTIQKKITEFHKGHFTFVHVVINCGTNNQSNTSVKYIQNSISIDNVECLCHSCMNKKGKVPPCAFANAMKFPQKNNFCLFK